MLKFWELACSENEDPVWIGGAGLGDVDDLLRLLDQAGHELWEAQALQVFTKLVLKERIRQLRTRNWWAQ